MNDSSPGPRRPDVATLLVAAMIVAALVGGTSTEMAQLHRLGARPPLWGFHPRPEQLVLPLFLHYGWLHWSCNVLLLWALSTALEVRIGGRALLYCFFLSGVSSILVSLWVHPQITSLGCSGAVFGLWTARLLHAWWPPGEPERWKFSALFLLGLGLSVLPSWRGLPVDHWAHGGGAIVGGLTYAAWRGGWWTRVAFGLLVMGVAGWVSRPPWAPDFSGITL